MRPALSVSQIWFVGWYYPPSCPSTILKKLSSSMDVPYHIPPGLKGNAQFGHSASLSPLLKEQRGHRFAAKKGTC